MGFNVTYGVDGLSTPATVAALAARWDGVGLANGGYAVVTQDGASGPSWVAFYNANGIFTGRSGPFAGADPALARLDNGNVVLTTTVPVSIGGGQFRDGVSYTLLSSAGATVSQVTLGETPMANSDVAGLVGGGFVIAQERTFFVGGGGTERDIKIYIRDVDGAALREFTVSAAPADDTKPAVTGLADGGFAVAWQRGVEIWYAVYNADGNERWPPTLLDNRFNGSINPVVTALNQGGFAVAYENYAGGALGSNIVVAEISAAGPVLDRTDRNFTGDDFNPTITTLGNGLLAIGANRVVGSPTFGSIFDPATNAFHDFEVTSGSFPSIAPFAAGKAILITGQGASAVAQPLLVRRTWFGDNANDVMVGDVLADTMSGGGGHDTLNGGEGNDLLSGQGGNDMFTGGAGADQFQADTGQDTIMDFQINVPGERIALDLAGIRTLVDVQARSSQIGLNTVITHASGTVTLRHVNVGDLRFEHFNGLENARANDFNGDARGDVLWRNSDGTLVSWEVGAGGTGFVSHSFGAVASGWQIAETGDFNADGRQDLLWRHTDNTVVAWLMNATSFTSLSFASSPNGSWRIAETGDLNDDGRSDVLWRHTDGTLVVWYVGQNGVASTRTYNGTDSSWHIVGAGDFSSFGSQHDGILWRHNDGTVVAWVIDRDDGSVFSRTLGAPDNTWRIEGTGSFDGGGQSDVLWRNTVTGEVVIWDSQVIAPHETKSLGGPDNSWQIQDVADFNGDGRSDILWRHTSGQVVEWLMNPGHTFSTRSLGAPGPTWSIVSDPTDFV